MILMVIIGLIISFLFIWGVVFTLFFGFVGLAFKSVFHAAWFAAKYIVLPAGIISFILCKLKKDADPKKIMTVVSVVWSVLFVISLNRNVIIQPVDVDDVAKVEMSSLYYNSDGELIDTDTVEMTSEQYIHDAVYFYNNVELKKVLKENIGKKDEAGYEINFVLYDKEGKVIQSMYVYDGYKMSITKNGITKYYARFDKENVFSISQMNAAVKGVHIKAAWGDYLQQLKNSVQLADSNTIEFTVPAIQPEVGRDMITVYYKYFEVREGKNTWITNYYNVDGKQSIDYNPGETVMIDIPEGLTLDEFKISVDIYDYESVYTENIDILEYIPEK